jgi:hypothetical protein
MLIEFSFHHVVRDPMIDKTIDSNVRKLEKLLSSFSPDLVRLHGLMEFTAPHQGPVCALNLWLPTGSLNFRHEGDTPLIALHDCFKHLIEQVKKHMAVVRQEGVWRRRLPAKKRISSNGSRPSRTSARAKAKSRVKERE